MANSKVIIKFNDTQLASEEVINIKLTYSEGVINLKETFLNTLASPRISQTTLISSDKETQAQLYLESLIADYSGTGLLSFKRNLSEVIIESVNDCFLQVDENFESCISWKINPFNLPQGEQVSVQYNDCNGDSQEINVGNDNTSFICAQHVTYVDLINDSFSGLYKAGTFQTQYGTVESTRTACNERAEPTYISYIFSHIPSISLDKIMVSIINLDCNNPDVNSQIEPITIFSTASENPCENIDLCITPAKPLVLLGTEGNTVVNTDTTICNTLTRGEDFTLQGYDEDGYFFTQTYVIPEPLTTLSYTLISENDSLESKITIINNSSLELVYKLDDGLWSKNEVYFVALGNVYTFWAKDNYGCVVSQEITIPEEPVINNQPQNRIITSSANLHELNVGKYLNLCNKQYTMKIGFIINAHPNAVKIFKAVSMILNTDYSIKNLFIKTSTDQERLVLGTHMVYRIREGMHSVPLKNPEDWCDLRGTWAYIELEIESIGNQKVDLFALTAHLRKSII